MKNLHRAIAAAAFTAFAAGAAFGQQFTMKLSSPTINDVALHQFPGIRDGRKERAPRGPFS